DAIDDYHELVAGDQRVCGEEPTLVDVEIGSADTRHRRAQPNFSGPRLRHRHLPNAELARPVVDNGFHPAPPSANLVVADLSKRASGCFTLSLAMGLALAHWRENLKYTRFWRLCRQQ